MAITLDLELYRRDVVISQQPRIRLSAIDVGPRDARRALVLIHGFAGWAAQWEHQLRFFSDEYRVVALDLRGHGLSDAPPSAYSLDEIQRDLERAFEVLGLPERFVLVGHSFGGGVVATYAVNHPERIEKLIIMSTASSFRVVGPGAFIFRTPAPVVELARNVVPGQNWPRAHVLKQLFPNALQAWDGRETLPKLRVPTLVVMGQRDFAFPWAVYQDVPELVPGAELVIIPVSAHQVQLERPDAVNRAIQRFVEASGVSWRGERHRVVRAPDYPWLKHYEPGVPHSVRVPDQPLHRFLESAAQRRPGRPATIFYGGTLSYRRLERQANRFANALHGLGVQKGDRVLILLPNSPQAIIAYYGTLKAGAIAVLANPVSSEEELFQQAADCGAQTAVTLSLFYPIVRRVADRLGMFPQTSACACATGAGEVSKDLGSPRGATPGIQHIIVTNIKEYMGWTQRVAFEATKEAPEGHRVDLSQDRQAHWLQDLLHQYPPDPPLAVDIGPEDVAVIQYTSGTTDEPKGVMLTHRNLVANVVQIRYWITDLRYGEEVALSALPLSHIYGQMACMNLAVSMAAAMVLLPTFDTSQVLQAVRRHKPTIFPGVPSMYVAINNFPGVRRYGLASIRACVSGAAPLPVEVQEAFEKLTRGRLVEGYGLTEAAPVTHINPLHGLRKAGSIGIPLPDTVARIVDPETGARLPVGEIGELCVRGPQVMKGYWNSPEDTAQVLRADPSDGDGPWLHTGDLARMDADGFFQIIDRKKDMILAGVFNVYPRDVEEVLYEHPKVLEAAAVGVPQPGGEQAVKAFVVLKPGERATPEEFIAYCRARLAEYAVPHWVEFRRELPRSMVGKVLRRLLVEEEESSSDHEES